MKIMECFFYDGSHATLNVFRSIATYIQGDGGSQAQLQPSQFSLVPAFGASVVPTLGWSIINERTTALASFSYFPFNTFRMGSSSYSLIHSKLIQLGVYITFFLVFLTSVGRYVLCKLTIFHLFSLSMETLMRQKQIQRIEQVANPCWRMAGGKIQTRSPSGNQQDA